MYSIWLHILCPLSAQEQRPHHFLERRSGAVSALSCTGLEGVPQITL